MLHCKGMPYLVKTVTEAMLHRLGSKRKHRVLCPRYGSGNYHNDLPWRYSYRVETVPEMPEQLLQHETALQCVNETATRVNLAITV